MKIAQLTVIQSIVDCQDQVFLVQDNQRLFGRSTICNFQIEDPLISAIHCYIMPQNGQFIVVDLLSANGVYHNENLVDKATLKNGDKIRIGKTTLEISEYSGNEKGKTYITGESPNISKRISKVAPHSEEENKTTLGRLIKKEEELDVLRLALKNQRITHEQIRNLIAQQQTLSSQGKEIDLNDLLIAEHILSKDDMQKLDAEHRYFKIRNKDLQLGEILVHQKLVIEPKVQECLKEQEDCYKKNQESPRLGEILVQKGYLTVHQNNEIIRALQQHRSNKKKAKEEKD